MSISDRRKISIHELGGHHTVKSRWARQEPGRAAASQGHGDPWCQLYFRLKGDIWWLLRSWRYDCRAWCFQGTRYTYAVFFGTEGASLPRSCALSPWSCACIFEKSEAQIMLGGFGSWYRYHPAFTPEVRVAVKGDSRNAMVGTAFLRLATLIVFSLP